MDVAAILNLTFVICGKYQEVELISSLNEYFNFDHNFYLLDSSADANRYINTTAITPQTLYVFKNENNGDIDDVQNITSKNTFLIVVPAENSWFEQNVNLFRWMKKIQQTKQINMKIGVFFSQHSSMQDLHTFFEWCKDNRIANIFAAAYPNSEVMRTSCQESPIDIFKFDPFGKFEVINVTGSATYDGFFLRRKPNFHKHSLRVADIPVTLIEQRLWSIAFSLMNATFVVVKFNATNGYYMTAGVDIYPQFRVQNHSMHLNVYPMGMTSIEIMVPVALPYPQFSAYLRNTMSSALTGWCLISIVALILILCILRYMKKKKFLLIQSAVDVFNLVLNDNGNINYQQLGRPEVFVIVPLTFVGLIFTNGILSNLQSYLTRPMLQHQIDTFEEIYTSTSVLLLLGQSQMEYIEDVTSRSNGLNWSNRVVVDAKLYEDSMFTLNQRMSYLTDSTDSKMFLAAQKRLTINAIHIPNVQLSTYHFGFVVHEEFLYLERLNEIINWMRSSGLYDLWYRQTEEQGVKFFVNQYKEQVLSQNETNIENFEFPMFLLYGWLAGLIVLILEIIWKRFGYLCKRNIARCLIEV